VEHDERPGELTRVLEGLRREIEGDVRALEGLAPVRARWAELEQLLVDLEHQLERVRRAAVITLVGATGAGKSTLLNALVGRAIALEGEARPTTAKPVVYRPRDADLSELVEGLPGAEPAIVDYDPAGGGPWRGQILVDAPDVNSIAVEHREVVRTLAGRSDVLVVVAHRQSISELASVEFVDAFAGRRRLLLVLNRADELTSAARAELLAELARIAAERWGAPDSFCVALSARRAKDDPDEPGWAELCAALAELVHEGRLGRVRRWIALGTADEIGRCFVALDDAGLGAELDALERALRAGLAGWSGALERELEARLELRRADLRAMLWNEAARRWDGPGGWALRAGGLTGLSLGAGAALARRNPLIAAGAALSGLAVERAREGARERGLRDASGLLPEPSELESAYRAHLGEARLVAARLAGEPESLGVPAGATLASLAADAVDEAWSRLIERDLPEVAAAGVSPLARLAIDAPVYALAGWVVARAARGFFEGRYVGLDLLVNAALLLCAWLFLGRSLVRASLSARAGGLVAATRDGAARRLASAAERAAQPTVERLATQRSALDRLRDARTRWRARLVSE